MQQQQQQQERLRQQEQEHRRYKERVDRAASAHAYAQKINNISAMLIEIGNYEKAIASLGKALKLSEVHMTDQLLDRSACTTDCSLDGCITHSEQDSNLIEVLDISNNNKKRNANNRKRDANGNNNEKNEHTLYRKPIRIPKQIIREGQNMGNTLFLIITFNLALAHHLKALKKTSSSSVSSLLNSTVQLYELANNWHQDQQKFNYVSDDDDHSSDDDYSDDDTILSTLSMEETNTYSARFNTILYNNLSHLNQLMMRNNNNNDDGCSQTTRSSSKRRLDNLLSSATIIDVRSVNTNTDTAQQQQQTSSSQSPCTTTTDTYFVRRVSQNNDDDDLQFEYYNKNEEDEFFDQQQQREKRLCR